MGKYNLSKRKKTNKKYITQNEFDELIKKDSDELIIQFNKDWEKARNKDTFLVKFKNELNNSLSVLQSKLSINQDLPNIRNNFDLDNNYSDFFKAIEHYCELTGKNFNEISTDIARYIAKHWVWLKISRIIINPNGLSCELAYYCNKSSSQELISKFTNPNADITNINKGIVEFIEPSTPFNSEENYFCKSMPLNIPKEHFKVFTEKKSKNGKVYLTVEQFNIFIEKAFSGKKELPKQKFNQTPRGEKLLIQTVFYEFYNTNCIVYFHTMQCQDIFIKLLTENFEGWGFNNVKANFTPKTKKRL